MVAPIIRRYTLALPAALNVFTALTDDITALGFQNFAGPNQILDIVNDPDPAAGLRYEIAVFKNGVDTGRHFFTNSLSPASAGRVAVGPLDLTGGQLQYQGAQRLGALTATSVIVKYAKSF